MPKYQVSDANTGKKYVISAPDQQSAMAAFQKFSGGDGGAATPPDVPGSRAYADWAAARARSGQTLPQVSPPPPTASDNGGLSPMSASFAAANQGITGAIPGLNQAADALSAGGLTIGDILANRPGTLSQHYGELQKRREQISNAAPIADMTGALAGTVAGAGALGSTELGAEALGMSGNWLKQLVNSSASTAGYEGLQGLSKGHTGGQLLADEGIGGLSGAGGAVVGQAVKGIGNSLADNATRTAQNKLINNATQGATLTSRDVKNAGQVMFNTAFPQGNIPMVHDNSVMRLVGDIQNGVQKFRPNAANDPKAVGLLQHIMELADAANTPGQAVDIQDLHLASQLADKVAKSPEGRDSAIGTIVGHKIDGFIKTLKSSDILGNEDPTAKTTALMQGISTWAKAKKADILEEAVDKAKGYTSGYENGLKRTFDGIIRNRDQFSRFTPAEQAAITQVAKGTTGQNAASALGKLGFNFNGGHGVTNIVGGGLGTAGVASALAPFVGPAAPFLAPAITTPIGAAGRRIATNMADASARRAIQAVAIGGIPTAKRATSALAANSGDTSIAVRSILPLLIGAAAGRGL